MNPPEKSLKHANEFTAKYFKDPNLLPALQTNISESEEDLSAIVKNTTQFYELIYRERKKRWAGDLTGLFAEEAHIPATKHADGRIRREESGYKVNVDYLRTLEIDPSKILFFRITQPSEEPKPEYYWTSDYLEALRGLDREDNAVILVSTLDAINQNCGLMQDINDDEGISVRQIGTGPFAQKKAIARFRPDQGLYTSKPLTPSDLLKKHPNLYK